METMVLIALIGAGVGALTTWMLKKPKTDEAVLFKASKYEELETSLKTTAEQLQTAQNELAQSQKAAGRVEELARTNEEQKNKLYDLTQKLEDANAKLKTAEQEQIKVREQKEALEKAQAEQEKNLRQLMSEQEKKFNALQEKSQSEFSRMAAESVGALKKQAEEALSKSRSELQSQSASLLTPLTETMNRFNGTLNQFKDTSISRHEELKNALSKTLEMNETLSKEAENLTNALKAPKTQGCWGELTLEEVLTSAGFQEGREYDKQVCFKGENNERQLPDFIVHLPGDRHIIIDSKMSINSYVDWSNAANEADRAQFLKQHLSAIRKHIDELSAKDYQAKLIKNGLEFVFMFIPIEYAYFAALKADKDLNAYAKSKKVAIVTPSNLFSVMQVVEQLWRVERTSKMLDEILKTGADMHTRVLRFLERMDGIKSALNSADKAYEDANTALQGKQGIIRAAEHLERLGINHKNSVKPYLDNETAPVSLPDAPKSED